MKVKFSQVFVAFAALVSRVESQSVPNACFCVTAGACNNNNNGGNSNGGGNTNGQDGSGQIDIRIQTNANPPSSQTGSQFPLTFAAFTGVNYVVNNNQNCQAGLATCCPSSGYKCGMRYPPVQGSLQPTPGSGQSQYGSYPWTAVITSGPDTNQLFIATGALIDQQHVLTVAHKVNQYLNNPQSLNVLLGEWDGGVNNEPIPSQQFTVLRVFTHPQVNYGNLRNDVAILRLSTAVNLGATPTITTACLPNQTIPMNIRCWVAGWGVSTFGGNDFSAIQKEVDVPLVDSNACQNMLRQTKVGPQFILDTTSFLCAGGESGKDACTGDGGSPLVCQISNQWYVIGLVAWGIGCGTSNVPGVYVNVANYINWIQQTTRQF